VTRARFVLPVIACLSLWASAAQANCDDTAFDCLDHEVVKAMQSALVAHGQQPGSVDGRWGRRTCKALNTFLASRGLGPAGDFLEPYQVKALWDLTFDYENASAEERIDFLLKIGVTGR